MTHSRMSIRQLLVSLLLPCAVIVSEGCSGDPDPDKGSPADTDTDSDADTDSDTDTATAGCTVDPTGNTVGLLLCDERAAPGYTLFAPLDSNAERLPRLSRHLRLARSGSSWIV